MSIAQAINFGDELSYELMEVAQSQSHLPTANAILGVVHNLRKTLNVLVRVQYYKWSNTTV